METRNEYEDEDGLNTPERPDELPPESGEEEGEPVTVEVEAEEPSAEPEKEEKEEVKKPKNRAKDRISQLVHRVHQYEDTVREMREEREMMRQEIDEAHKAATRHFDDSVALQLDKAKQLKRQALESGDVDAITDADVAIASAASAMQQAQVLKHQQKRYDEEYQAPQEDHQNGAPQEYSQELQRFASQNTWYYPDSQDYDERMATKLRKEVDSFERQLMNRGQGHLIGSRPYFQEINRYIASELMIDDEPAPQKREVRMKPQAYTSTAPGRTAGRLPLQKETRKLTTDERLMGRRAGAKSDEEILKVILETEREMERDTGRRTR